MISILEIAKCVNLTNLKLGIINLKSRIFIIGSQC